MRRWKASFLKAGKDAIIAKPAAEAGVPQKPERQSRERDAKAVQRWIRTDWPRIKKSPPTERRHRLPRRKRLHDGSGGSQDLGAAWTAPHSHPARPLAPEGLRHRGPDRSPCRQRAGLYFSLLVDGNITAARVIRFVRELLLQLQKPMILVCDRSPSRGHSPD